MGGEEPQKPGFFVAVHVGAGYHAPSNEKALRSAMKRACLAAASVLRKGPGVSVDAVAAAIQVFEVETQFFSFFFVFIFLTVCWSLGRIL